ncbi:MAG: hypothetical protein LBS32_07445 [Clostridiales Family XIII bacterium]|jgi:hypothetical protein|nr:hypothetical protein [Clostridiales Family XIII bacterium]
MGQAAEGLRGLLGLPLDEAAALLDAEGAPFSVRETSPRPDGRLAGRDGPAAPCAPADARRIVIRARLDGAGLPELTVAAVQGLGLQGSPDAASHG